MEMTMMTPTIKTYSELVLLPSFEERFRYLSLKGTVAKETFGFDRFINQKFYCSREWKALRDEIIVRDNGCDLGVDGYEIYDKILIHHMNPIYLNDIVYQTKYLLDPEFLICVSHNTHNAIHYGDENLLITSPIPRTKNDTCPWRK